MNSSQFVANLPFSLQIVSPNKEARQSILLHCLYLNRHHFPYGWLFAEDKRLWQGFMPKRATLTAWDDEWYERIKKNQVDRVGRANINEHIFLAFDGTTPIPENIDRRGLSVSLFELRDTPAEEERDITFTQDADGKWTIYFANTKEVIGPMNIEEPRRIFHMLCVTAWGDEVKCNRWKPKKPKTENYLRQTKSWDKESFKDILN